jgi:hypothetical protein
MMPEFDFQEKALRFLFDEGSEVRRGRASHYEIMILLIHLKLYTYDVLLSLRSICWWPELVGIQLDF